MILPGCVLFEGRRPPPVLYVGSTTQPLADRLFARGHRGVRASRAEGMALACVTTNLPPETPLRVVKRWEAHYAYLLRPRVDGESRPKADYPPRNIGWMWVPVEYGMMAHLTRPPYLYVLV